MTDEKRSLATKKEVKPVFIFVVVKDPDQLMQTNNDVTIHGYKVIKSSNFDLIFYNAQHLNDSQLKTACLMADPIDVEESYFFKVTDYSSGNDAENAALKKVAELYAEQL